MIDPRLATQLLEQNERMPHRAHQLEGVLWLLERKFGGLYDEVGAGKTKQIVDTAQILWLQKEIDTVLVVAPGYARSTWADEDPLLGEVAKHAWESVPNVIHEYHKHYTDLEFHSAALNWVVTNYEFIRRDARLWDLMKQLRTRRSWLVIDESWAIANFSDQMKAVRTLRVKRSARVTQLNGTPLADGAPEDLYYPMNILDPSILDAKNRAEFRTRHCIMGGYMNKQVVDYQNLDDLNARIAPYVLSRRTRDCFDLPPMLDPITLEAPLDPPNWKIYKDQRDDMVSWLGDQVSVSQQAIVKILRLSQITSGYLGGLETLEVAAPPPTDLPEYLFKLHGDVVAPTAPLAGPAVREIGREKLDVLLRWLKGQNILKLLVWCRFRPELERTTDALRALYPNVFQLRGNQTEDERRAAKDFLAPGPDTRRGCVVGNPKAGGASLNFSGANIAVYLSRSPALIERTQSIGRIERPGATQPMLIVDVVATGPKGQKTCDHAILKALRGKEDMARWTVDQWRKLVAES